MPVSLPTDADRTQRQARLSIRRAQYTFEDQPPLAPIPLMKPLSRTQPARMKLLIELMAARRGITKIYDEVRDTARTILGALIPDFIEDPIRRMFSHDEDDPEGEERGYVIRAISRLLFDELDPDPDEVSQVGLFLDAFLSTLDSSDDSPYPYDNLLYALFDLPLSDLLREVTVRPSFPGADPDGTYFSVRNTDLLTVRLMGQEMRQRVRSELPQINGERRFPDLESCAAFFPRPELRGTTATGTPNAIPRSLTTRLLDDDVEFAWQRLGGVNPVILQRLNAADAPDDRGGVRLPLESWPELGASLGDFEALMDHTVGQPTTFRAALRSGRLFVADYREITAASAITDPEQPRIYAPTVGLFYADPDQGLLPVAIRLGSGADAMVYTPLEAGQDRRPWRSAKLLFQVADLIHHEMVSHLLESHFVLEGIAVATQRRLDRTHPVAVLLHAHLRGVVFNLMVGRRLLLAAGNGMVDQLFPLQPQEWVNVLREGYRTWRASDLDAPSTFRRKGTDDVSVLPTYPYRDDTMLLWGALHDYVSEYLEIFYPTEDAVRSDEELRDWQDELLRVYARPMDDADTGAAERAAGFRFSTRAELARLLTGILFTSGPRHAAVNFAQWDYMMFVGNTPAAAYVRDTDNLPDAEQILPTAEQVVNQMEVIQLLSGRQFGRLGHFPDDEFQADGPEGQRIQLVIRRLQDRLSAIADRIDARNNPDSADPHRRTREYPYLHPDRIPNAANV